MANTPLIQPRNIVLASRQAMKPGTYFVQTWGCQMNEEDSEQIGLYLQGIGFEPASSIVEAQVVILNTCSVRKKPEDKAFSLLGELIPFKKVSPEIILGVCGCMAQLRADEIRRRAPHVDFVVGTGQIAQIPALVAEATQNRHFQKRLSLPERKGATVEEMPQRAVGRAPKLKSFVPIQYGCDKFCTFCIVPSTRGRERSRPVEDIVDEVRQLVDQGTREVTLLGQTVNSYGKTLVGGKLPFSELLWRLNEVEGLERIRYTSPYPKDFRSDLIETIRDCPKVMEHCHMPLQSGDDDVLREMKRLYTVASYRQIVMDMRTAMPEIGLTTDIIVGFPGETDEQFENTLNVMREIRFDGAYMFAYSIRPDTPAGDRADQVPEATKKDRLDQLITLQNDITREINETYIGSTVEVLIEGPSPKRPAMLQGYSREFKMVAFAGSSSRTGRVARVQITEAHLWGLTGELVRSET